jgi:hypothetical protein
MVIIFLCRVVVDVREALVGVGIVIFSEGNYSFDKGNIFGARSDAH